MRALWLLLAALSIGGAARSGYEDATPAVRAMQDDDSANPGGLWVEQGEAIWARDCAGCHGAPESMRGVATRYPKVVAGRVVTLSDQVSHARVVKWAAESDEALSLTALIGRQSRGMAMAVDADAAGDVLARGRAVFERRMGQLDLSCADCHDGLAGQRLGGSRIPQGQPNGYPEYRLEWQTLGSLERRLRNCMTGMRAEPFAAGDPELGALEFFLGWRANGLLVETPGVRP